MVVVPNGDAALDPKGEAALVATAAFETAAELVGVLPKTEPLLADPPNMLDPPPNALEVDVVDVVFPPKTLADVVVVDEPPKTLEDAGLAAAAPPNTLADVVAGVEPPKTPGPRNKDTSRENKNLFN